jgi:hypothetical protein
MSSSHQVVGAIIATAVILSGRSYAQEAPLPEVSVTAPAPRPEPPYLRNPWKSYERNPYDGRYRVEEDKFAKVACSQTRIAFGSGGTCLKGYRLASGCDMVLDVVSYTNENLSIEADTLVFDPYKLSGAGHISIHCNVQSHRSYDQEDFQDMNQVTRRGANWHNFLVDDADGQNRSIEFMDGSHNCIAILRHGPRWQGGYVYMLHASICRTDAASVQPQDVAYVIGSLRVQEYDPVGNIRPPPIPAATTPAAMTMGSAPR